MIDNTLSICMIVKNEEKNLARCLESVKNISDEIIIVDTGSTDKTVEIAKKYTDKVILYEWKNDFSDARNKSLEYATKNWIFVIDADEVIPYSEGLKLKTILKENSQLDAFHIRLVNYVYDVNIGDSIVLRVFKNKPNYRFRGKMHEQIIKAINESVPPGTVGSTDIKIIHYGYDPKQADIPLKQQRNLDLLNSYPEEERDGYFYYSLGNEYARIQKYDKALEIYKKCEEYPIEGQGMPIYLCYLAVNVSKTLSSAGRIKEEVKRLKEYEKKYSNFKDLYFLEYLAQANCGHFTEAKNAIITYINTPKGCYEYPDGNYDKQFNINELVNTINNFSVEHRSNLLSVIILADEGEENLFNTVKNINEIADEVIVATKNISLAEKESLENIYARVLDFSDGNREKMFVNAYKNSNCEYVLLLKSGEIINAENQKKLVEVLSCSTNEFFNTNVVTINQSITSSEFRILKNQNVLKEFKSLYEYVQYIDSKFIEDINVLISKFIK